MKIETIVTFTDEDKELLRKPLPKNPCDECDPAGGCCGCSDAREYAKMVEPYRKAGVYEIAREIESMKKIEAEARTLIDKYQKINETLPNFVKQHTLSINRSSYYD